MKTIFTVSLAYFVMVLPLFLGGCAKSDSAAIGTSEIVPTYVVQNNTGRISCQAVFNVGGPTGTFIELSEGDKVSCSDGERTLPLTKSDTLFNMVSYYGGSDLHYEPGREYSFIFERKDGTRIVSSIALPPEVQVRAPAAGQTSFKGQELPVRWNRAGATAMEVTLSWEGHDGGSSTGSNRRATEDNGAFNFIPEETRVKGADGRPISGDVRASVEVVRISRAGVSPKFRTGTIAGKQSQTVRFTLID